MSNKVNMIAANASAKTAALQASLKTKLNLDKQDKATPVKSEGYMLPSRIFGSPKRYINNLKNDVVTIQKGAMGKANDHELGRLNDLAMKAGSLLLAAYLFTTKPFKTSKAMEFVGFGTFFALFRLRLRPEQELIFTENMLILWAVKRCFSRIHNMFLGL